MNYIKRAIISTRARIVKTTVLFGIMVTVCVIVLAGFGIQAATEEASILARKKLGAEVSLQVDTNKLREQTMSSMNSGGERVRMEAVPVPLSYLTELSQSPYVESYNILSETTVNAVDFEAVDSETSTELVPSKGMGMGGSSGDLTLSGVRELSIIDSFSNGENTLVDGRLITSSDEGTNVVLIEQTLAEDNDLAVGDYISITSSSDDSMVKELQIIGLFATNTEYNQQMSMNTFSNPYNLLYVPYETANYFKGDDYSNGADKIVFILDDPINVESFLADTEYSSIDFDLFTLDGSTDEYEQMMGPIENVASFSQTTIIMVIVFGALILTLIITLTIKDRTNEMGILLSLGEKKVNIIGQLLVESLIVLFVAFIISLLVGNVVTNVVTDQLLSNELSVMAESQSTTAFMQQSPGNFQDFMQNQTQYETITELDVSLSILEFGQMMGVTTLIAIVAALLPAVYIMRLNPKAILSQHS